MDAGYRFILKRVTEAWSPRFNFVHPPTLPIPESTQLPEYTISHPDAEMELGHKRREMSPNVKEEAPYPKNLLEALLLPLFVLLLLVPGSLLCVERVRKVNNDNELPNWRDQYDRYPSTTDNGEERPPAVIEVAGFDIFQPAVVATDSLVVEVKKCEGWRDWVDYGSGWRGCVP